MQIKRLHTCWAKINGRRLNEAGCTDLDSAMRCCAEINFNKIIGVLNMEKNPNTLSLGREPQAVYEIDRLTKDGRLRQSGAGGVVY